MLLRTLSLARPWPPPRCVLTWPSPGLCVICALLSSCFEDTSPVGAGLPHTASLHLTYVFNGFSSRPVLRSRGLGLPRMNLEETYFSPQITIIIKVMINYCSIILMAHLGSLLSGPVTCSSYLSSTFLGLTQALRPRPLDSLVTAFICSLCQGPGYCAEQVGSRSVDLDMTWFPEPSPSLTVCSGSAPDLLSRRICWSPTCARHCARLWWW